MRRTTALFLFSILAACGGGGGGGGSAPGGGGGASGGQGGGGAGSNAPTFQFSGFDDENRRWAGVAEETVVTGASLLTYAQFATDLVHRFAAPESNGPITANCAYSGRITMQLNDPDSNGRASTGDSITAVLENCGVPALRRAATGVVRIDVRSSVSQSVTTDFVARLTVVEALQLAALAGGGNLGVQNYGVLRGSLGAEWSEDATGSVLRAVSTTEDDLNFTGTYDGVQSVDRMREIDVSQAVHYDEATSTSSVAFLYDVGSRGGMLRVRTPAILQGDLDVVPRHMRVELEIGGGRLLRVERGTLSTGPVVNLSLVSAAGTEQKSAWVPWNRNVLRFADDVRNTEEPSSSTDRGWSVHAIRSWRESAHLSDVDRACLQQSSSPQFKADAVFQRPVASPRALSEADGVVRLQFNRAIAASTPTFHFRFADDSRTAWNVTATAVRRGAYYEVRPTEPLVKGGVYLLQLSKDGSDWSADLEFLDADGNVMSRHNSSLASFYIESSLMIDIDFGDTGTANAAAPARLRARPTLAAGQTLANVQWKQMTGAPVTLSASNNLETDAILPGPREVEDVVMQVTVTDSRGATDRARVMVSIGDHVSSGAALYTEAIVGGRSIRSLAKGVGSIFYGPELGGVHPRLNGPGEGGTGVSFSVTTVGGAQLQPGVYANASYTDVPGSTPGLISRVWCNTRSSPVSGSFEVLEVAYALDGRITLLALDYEQRCDQGGEYDRGSYRFNSTRPLKP